MGITRGALPGGSKKTMWLMVQHMQLPLLVSIVGIWGPEARLDLDFGIRRFLFRLHKFS